MDQKDNSAKYVYFYLLSLVSLAFMTISAGMVIFQVINKYVFDAFSANNSCYSPEALKFAISAIIIAAPIYFFCACLINKNLRLGFIGRDSSIRKWLTYLILFISSIVVLGNLIAISNNFFSGELTTKFALKTLAIFILSIIVFSFYLYDIRREEINGRDRVIKTYLYASLAAAVAIFILGIILSGSPEKARKEKIDGKILEKMNNIKMGMQNFYDNKKRLPKNLDEMIQDSLNVKEDDAIHPIENKKFGYNALEERKYEICATFYTANNDNKVCPEYYAWSGKEWEHGNGYQCIKGEVYRNEK